GRADVGHARRHPVVERRPGEHADFCRRPAFEKRELARAGDLLTEANASRAVDTAIHVLHDVRTDGRAIHAGVCPLEFAVARFDRTVVARIVLQRTLAGLRADPTSVSPTDEPELG